MPEEEDKVCWGGIQEDVFEGEEQGESQRAQQRPVLRRRDQR